MDIANAIEEISQERDIEQKTIIKALEETMLVAAQKKYTNYKEIEARYEEGQIFLFQYKKVVNKVEDEDNEISLKIAKEVDSEAQLDDEIEYEIDKEEYIDVLAQTVRQVLFQKIKEYENELLKEKYRDKIGQILTGQIERFTRDKCIISLQKNSTAILEYKEQIQGERLNLGDTIRALLYEIGAVEKRVVLKLSRTHPNFLRELFKLEVPEVEDETIEILSVARDPGKRAKVMVRSNNSDVDPVGSCVGKGGGRIQAVVNELHGEKIDVIRYTESIEQQIIDAMVPAQLQRVKVDEENSVADIFVDEDNLALAIGKKGQNIKLASRLIKFELNIRTLETTVEEKQEELPAVQLFENNPVSQQENLMGLENLQEE